MANRDLPECIACGRPCNTTKQVESVRDVITQLHLTGEYARQGAYMTLIVGELVRAAGGKVVLGREAVARIEDAMNKIVQGDTAEIDEPTIEFRPAAVQSFVYDRKERDMHITIGPAPIIVTH